MTLDFYTAKVNVDSHSVNNSSEISEQVHFFLLPLSLAKYTYSKNNAQVFRKKEK